MAEGLLLHLAKTVTEKLTNTFMFEPATTYDEEGIKGAMSVEDDLNIITNHMEVICAVLADAETKHIDNDCIKVWLRDLRCIIYDLDDLLDEAATDALQHCVAKDHFCLSSRYSFRSFHLTSDIQDIRAKLECIEAKKDEFGLTEATDDEPSTDNVRDYSDKFTTMGDPIIIGRDKATQDIISKVLSVSNANVSVLPIVGIGGIGKTTLAKLVHRDVPNFDLKLWACVSEKLNVNNILANILHNNYLSNDASGNNIEQLIEKIYELLKGNKYFLVLDDMWVEDIIEWKRLEEILAIGEAGSMILITTRYTKVASITKTMEPYNLVRLSKQDSWSIFRQLAFEGVAEEARYPNLQKIGKSMVGKFCGIPLAVKVMASMLRSERNEHEWQQIQDSDGFANLRNDEHEAIVMQLSKLSYDRLRPEVKQCFGNMSLYPKDYIFDSSDMLDIGIALGLFQQKNGNKEIELACSYLTELTSYSLLSIEKKPKCKSAVVGFKLHNLMHDLATDVLGDELADVTTHKMPILSDYTRHIIWEHQHSIDSLAPKEFPTELGKATKARTFRIIGVNVIGRAILDEIISKLVCLRILDLSDGLFEELPKSIENLSHLRYLDLTGNFIIEGLPNTICKLVNLDTFHLKGCERLKELPKDVYLLLWLRKFTVTTLQDSFIGTKINELSSLQHLEIYSCPRLVSLWDSGNARGLTSLQTLSISGCPKLAHLPDSIESLVDLESLSLHNCEEMDLEAEQGVQGLRNLKALYVSKLPKLTCLPQSILSAKATLQTLELADCEGLEKLVDPLTDWFGELSSLGRIVIERCPKLLAFPNSICRLDTLQEVVILESPHLAKSCSLTPESKAIDFTLIHHVLSIQIDDAILTKEQNQQTQEKRDPLRTSVMSFWANAVDLTSKEQQRR